MDLFQKIANLPLPVGTSLLEVTKTEYVFNHEFILVGRGQSGSLHLLFQIPENEFEENQKMLTNGFSIGFRKLQQNADRPIENYIELSTIENFDENLFVAIANEIFSECNSRTDLVALVTEILDRWKYLLSQKFYQRFGPEQAIGLFGELIVLRSAIAHFGEDSINRWTGPNRASHDFEFDGFSLEVKTFFPLHPTKIHVHGFPQLQSINGKTLHLVTIALLPSPLGQSLSDIVVDLKGKVPSSISEFDRKLWATGYRDDLEISTDLKLNVEELGKTLVDESFPRPNVSESTFESRISELNYVLDLEGLLKTNYSLDFIDFWGN